MEFNISDLLDDLGEVDIDIQPNTRASAERIKELTMKKIHSGKKQYRRGLSTLSKILITAAVIAALAIPVAAATGFHFTDWLEGILVSGEDYDTDLAQGSDSKNWEVSDYVLDVKAETASATGLTLTCEEWGNGEKTGILTADDSFWLEQWDGSGYTAMTPKSAPAAGQSKTIAPDSVATWQVNWADSYGTLPSGSYRIGKTITYTDPAGKTQCMDFYAKFRVFAEDMAPYVESSKAALEEVLARDSYHLTSTMYPEGGETLITGGVYQYYTSTIWKNGDDYLEELQYVSKDGTVIAHEGYLFRNGKGYRLAWNGADVFSSLASWEAADYLDETQCEMWEFSLEIFDASVGEVYADGNAISFLECHSFTRDEEKIETLWYKKTYTMDEQGKLISARFASIPSPEEFDQEEVQNIVEIHDTSVAEIAKVIAAQNVDKPVSFSWSEEQAKYPAGSEGVKTEGFANTAAQTVNMGNVVSIAQKECTLEWQNTAVVFYDGTAQVWKVELGFSQDDTVCQTVYLSDEGITLMVVTK